MSMTGVLKNTHKYTKTKISMISLSKFMTEQFVLLERKGITRDGKKVTIDYPEKLRGDEKEFIVYRPTDKKDDETGLPIVFGIKYGQASAEIKNDDPKASKSFWARHKCDQQKNKDSAAYWACWTSVKHGKRLGLKGGNKRW